MYRIKALLAIIFLSVIGYSTPANADFEKGMEAYRLENYETAFAEFKLAAEKGDDRAFGKLGALYLYGRGTDKDYLKAYIWFGLAALSGDKYAPRYRDAASSMLNSTQVYQAEEEITTLSEKFNTQ